MNSLSLQAERVELLAALQRQLPCLSDPDSRARTERAIRQLERELAPGRAAETEAVAWR